MNFSTMAVAVSGFAAGVLDVEDELDAVDAPLGVDLLDGHLVGLLLDLAELRLGAGQRQGNTHLERLALRRERRSAKAQGKNERDG